MPEFFKKDTFSEMITNALRTINQKGFKEKSMLELKMRISKLWTKSEPFIASSEKSIRRKGYGVSQGNYDFCLVWLTSVRVAP